MYAPPHSRPSAPSQSRLQLGRHWLLTLKLDLVLYDESLALVVDLGWEFGRDGMMSSGVLEDKAFVAHHAREDSWLFYRPLSDVGPVLITL